MRGRKKTRWWRRKRDCSRMGEEEEEKEVEEVEEVVDGVSKKV